MSLPSKLYEVFELDEGLRPGICFEGLSSNQVIEVYAHIKENIGKLPSDYTVWSNKLEAEVELSSFKNPAVEVTTGEICQFCHYISDYSYKSNLVTNVSIYVFSDSLEIFYDVRDIKSKNEIEQVLNLVKKISSLCPNSSPFFAEENGTPRKAEYQDLLTELVTA